VSKHDDLLASVQQQHHACSDPTVTCRSANEHILCERIAMLEVLLQRVLHHGPIVPIQLAAEIVAAGITRPVRSTSASAHETTP
jgi:hypothetical protein